MGICTHLGRQETRWNIWKRLRLPRQRRYPRQLAKRAGGVGKMPPWVGIEQRHAKVEERRLIGHWEGDKLLKDHKEAGLMPLVE